MQQVEILGDYHFPAGVLASTLPGYFQGFSYGRALRICWSYDHTNQPDKVWTYVILYVAVRLEFDLMRTFAR